MIVKPNTPEELAECLRKFSYDPETGILSGAIIAKQKSHRFGKPIGALTNGYLTTWLGGRNVFVHRIVWAMFYGSWPVGTIDHIDGDRLNNRIANLRDVSHAVNMRNQAQRSTNTSGVIGVYWVKRAKRWIAKIMVDGKDIHIGSSPSFEVAVAMRKAAEKMHGFHENHGRLH